MSVCLHCGEKNEIGETHCIACDKEIGTSPLRRVGSEFEATPGVVLPPACVKCGAPAEPPKKPQAFFWHHPGFYFLILAGVIVYAIVAICVRKRFDLAVPMCAAHLKRRRALRWTGTALLVAMIALLVVGIPSRNDTVQGVACVGSVASLLAALIVFIVSERTIRPTNITDRSARFAGADERFLAMLD